MSETVTFDDVWKMFQEMVRENRERNAELDRKFQETDQKIKQVSQQIGQLGSRWGEFVEGMVAPACETLFAARGIPVHQVHQRVRTRLPGNRHMEIDLLVVDGDAVILVEVKSRLKAEDVREHLERLGAFKEFFPRYAECRVMGAVAGMVIDEDVDQYAMKQGLFVMAPSGETVTLANDPAFAPRAW